MNNELYFLIIVIEVIILLILLYTYFNKKKIKEHHADHSPNGGITFYDRHCGIYPVVKRVKQAAVCEDGTLVVGKDRCNQPGVYRKSDSDKVIINGDSGEKYEVSLKDRPNDAVAIKAFLADNTTTCAPPTAKLLEKLGLISTDAAYIDAQNSWEKYGHYVHTISLGDGFTLSKNVAAGSQVSFVDDNGSKSTKITGTVVSRTMKDETTLIIKQDIPTQTAKANISADADGIFRFTDIEFEPTGKIIFQYEDGFYADTNLAVSTTTSASATPSQEAGSKTEQTPITTQGIKYSKIVKVKSATAQFWEQQYKALGEQFLSDVANAEKLSELGQEAFYQIGGLTANTGTQYGSIVGSLVSNGNSCKQMGKFKAPEEEPLNLGDRCGDYNGNKYNGCDPKDYRTENSGSSLPNKDNGKYFSFIENPSSEEQTKLKKNASEYGFQESDTGKLKTMAGATEGADNKVSEAAGKEGRKSIPNTGKVRASLDSDYKVISRDCIPAAPPGVIIHEHFSSPFDSIYSRVSTYGNKITSLLGFNTNKEHFDLTSEKGLVGNAAAGSSITKYIGSRDITCRDTSRNPTPTKPENWIKQHMRMRNNAMCTITQNGGPLEYKVEKLVEISANSGFYTITIRLHADPKLNWKMGHDTINETANKKSKKKGTDAASGKTAWTSHDTASFVTDYRSDLFYREFKHVIDYSKVDAYDGVAFSGGYDFGKAIKKSVPGQYGGGNISPGDKQAYDNFKWTFGENGRSSKPHIDITTCPIPWNAVPAQIVKAISKVWKNFAINNFENVRNIGAAGQVDVDTKTSEDNRIKQQYMTLNGVIVKPKLAIHIQDVHQAQVDPGASVTKPGTKNIYNYTEKIAIKPYFGNDLLFEYNEAGGDQTKNLESKIVWTSDTTGTLSKALGTWELDTSSDSPFTECPTRRSYNSNTNKSRRAGTATISNLSSNLEGSKKMSQTINCIPYNTQEEKSKFVPRRIRIGFIDTGNFTPSYENLELIVNTVPKTQLEAYQRQIVLNPDGLVEVAGVGDYSGDIKTGTDNFPMPDAYKAFILSDLSTLDNGFTKATSTSNGLNGGPFNYITENEGIDINNIANWDKDKILSIGLGDFEDPDKGSGQVYLVQKSNDGRENCHSGFGDISVDFRGQHDQNYPDSCLQSRSYVVNTSTSDFNTSQWDSHGRFLLGNNDIEQHLRDRHNINIIENPQDQTLVFFVFYKEDDIKKDYSYNNVEALKLATYWEKLTREASGNKEIYMKMNYLIRLFNETKTMSIKENKLYQTLVMINNYLSSSYRLTRSRRQLNGKVSNTLKDLSNFARRHSGDLTKGFTAITGDMLQAEQLKIVMRKPGSSITFSNPKGTKIQDLSNPYREKLKFFSKDIVIGIANKYKTTKVVDASDQTTLSQSDVKKLYDAIPHGNTEEQPIADDIYFDFDALISFLQADEGEAQDVTFSGANSGNRVWGITQGTITTAGTLQQASGYDERDARARPAAWSDDFNICNEELSTSKFADEMKYRSGLTNTLVDDTNVSKGDQAGPFYHTDFRPSKDTHTLNPSAQPETALQVMMGKYPARVAAWAGRNASATIDTAYGSETYGKAIGGAVSSILASKFSATGAAGSNQIAGVVGGVSLSVGSKSGSVLKAEGVKVAISVGASIKVIYSGVGGGMSTGKVSTAVDKGSGTFNVTLTIGGEDGIRQISSGAGAATGDFVYQLDNSNNVVAKGKLTKGVTSTTASATLVVTMDGGYGTFSETTPYPNLRLTPAGNSNALVEAGGAFDDTLTGVIKYNNLPPEATDAKKQLKLISVKAAAGSTGTSIIKITLDSDSLPFDASGNPELLVDGVGVFTETDKPLVLISAGGGALGGTLESAVDLYAIEF